MSEVIKREDTAIIFKRLDECRRHMNKGNIFSCLTSFREALRKMKVTRMLPADEKELNKIINEFQEQLPLSKTFRDVYGPVTFRDNDIDTALDFMNQLIFIKEEEIHQSLEAEGNEEVSEHQFATLEEKLEKIKVLINIGNYASAQELIGQDDDIISHLIDFYNSAGIEFRKSNEGEKAIQEFRKALVVYQQDEGLYYNLARAHVERSEWKSAEEAILNGLNINPEFPEGIALLNYIRQKIQPVTESPRVLPMPS